jgi:hypothetical protein
MKRNLFCCLALATLLAGLCYGQKVGAPAPDFKATDSNGRMRQLSEYRGKYVVLEWHNNGCPFTRKHYESGNMQRLQKEWTSRGVIWFTVISSAAGQQGYVTAEQENEYLKRMNAVPTAALLDPQGDVGRPMLPRPPHTCSSSTRMACSSMTGQSIANRPRTRAISQQQQITCHRLWAKQWQVKPSALQPHGPMDARSSMPIEESSYGNRDGT